MAVPPLDLTRQHQPILEELQDAVAQVVASGNYVLGPDVEAFELDLAQYCGANHAVGLSSGTDALLAAMMALDIGPGDQVITTPFSFFATGGAITRVGATPVFVDIDPHTFNMDLAQVEAAITDHTIAIMPVHLFGLPVSMTPLLELAKEHRLRVVVDAAQAIGAVDAGRPIGQLGDVVCLSFYPTKNLSAMGDAGACLTQSSQIYQRIRQARLHGQTEPYQHEFVGGNFRIDRLQAVILRIKLKYLDQWLTRRRELACRYFDKLSGLPVTLPDAPGEQVHVYHQFTLRIHHGKRDALRQHLMDRGIAAAIYYARPLHLQPCFANLDYHSGDLPEAERAADEVLSLPIFAEMTDKEQDQVTDAIIAFFT